MCVWKLCLLSSFFLFVTSLFFQVSWRHWRCDQLTISPFIPHGSVFHLTFCLIFTNPHLQFSSDSLCACFAVFTKFTASGTIALILRLRVGEAVITNTFSWSLWTIFWRHTHLLPCSVFLFLSHLLHCTWTLPGFHVHVSNPNPEGVDRSNARYNVSNGREVGPVRRHLFYFLPPCCHAGEFWERSSALPR